jgi:YggT family protein
MIFAISSLQWHAAAFVDDLAWVYTVAIIVYVISSLFFSLGLRIPYTGWSDAVLTFLREVSEPFLRLIRRILPPLGGLDLSPIVAIVLVRLAGSLATQAISGA